MLDITPFLQSALDEDIGTGDVTTDSIIPEDLQASFVMNARTNLTACGLMFLRPLFEILDDRVNIELLAEEGEEVTAGMDLARLSGSARVLLTGERTALNLVQQLSGVATLTRAYVEAVRGTETRILDTRKTIPGLRALQKYAVTCGGGKNHRMGLYDAVLIKDNHIAVAGGIAKAVAAAKAQVSPSMIIEVECDTLMQLDLALAAGVDIVLLDNMSNAQLRDAVLTVRDHNATTKQSVKTEASGNMSLDRVRAIAELGVNYISVGKLTHSAPAVDIGLDEVFSVVPR